VLSESPLVIDAQVDIERARRLARAMARAIGFTSADAEAVVLSVSELATNLLRYAQEGSILLDTIEETDRRGIRIESRDAGPGIANVECALLDGYSTGIGLGSGIPGVRRLMDEFQLETGPSGTWIVARKWIPAR
jgi:serine/threonine-protein kinase RsbT